MKEWVGTSLENHIKRRGRAGFSSHLAGPLQAAVVCLGRVSCPRGWVSITWSLSCSELDSKSCWEAALTSFPSLS